jgi:hypothetical protein
MPGLLSWIGNHVFDLLSAVGIISSLAYTSASFREGTRSRRLGNLLILTKQHREIWEKSLGNPKLARIRAPKADLHSKPVTAAEAQFVMFVIFHIHCWYRAVLDREVINLEGMGKDIQVLFSRPVPRHVWEERKSFLDSDFRQFVDSLLDS